MTAKEESKKEEEEEPQGYSIPRIRLRYNDVCSEGAKVFLGSGLNFHDVITEAVVGVLDALYTPKTAPKNVRSVTLIIRGMEGVAYTIGSDLDDDHKEIHFSHDYISNVHDGARGKNDKQEILGVIRHEMVHCFQYNSFGSANGGLIEGIADWVRYKGGFIPAHWHAGSGDEWDDGYEKTAYFLLWLEKQYGPETVPRINGWMKDHNYSDHLFIDLFGEKPEALYKKYKKACEEGEDTTPTPKNETESQTEDESNETPPHNEGDDQSFVEVSDERDVKALKGKSTSFSPSEMRLVARDRLCKLTFDGTGNLKRFFNSFEGLIGLLDPHMSDHERKLLLATALKGNALTWLDDIDPEDEMSYPDIRANLMANALFSFKSSAGNAAGVRESTKLQRIL
ncbi:hypothetical protein ABW20_dc0100592 [Dactylellina cionopaga]|nr:hypothetical protein ABW20_dc0100592 [Dactylellina cionopaga]